MIKQSWYVLKGSIIIVLLTNLKKFKYYNTYNNQKKNVRLNVNYITKKITNIIQKCSNDELNNVYCESNLIMYTVKVFAA